MVAANAVLGVMLGALAGTIAWAVQRSLLLFFVLATAGYLAETVLLGSARLTAAAVVELLPLTLTLLASWLTARNLEAHTRLRLGWATLVGFGVGLLLGFLWGFSLRLGLPAAVSLALGTDAALIALLYRGR